MNSKRGTLSQWMPAEQQGFFLHPKGIAMKHNRALVYIVAIGVAIWSFFMNASPAYCQSCEQWVAKIVSVQGAVQASKATERGWNPVQLNQTYCPEDRIRVLKNSRAAISLSNDTLIRVDQNTTITFTAEEKEKTSLINLIRGVAHFFSRFPKKFRVSTPFVNAAVEGTEFYLRVEDDQTFLSIFEGRVAVANAAGSLAVATGQSAVAEAGKAPVLQVVVNPRDAVQWALYYPPIIDWRPIDIAGGKETDWRGMARKSIEYYWQGDMVGAFSALGKAPEEIRDPRFYLYRAALFLTVGRIGAAQTDITKALSLNPSNSYAVALQSIIAVVHNERDRALELANRAVKLAPQSSTALVALSYARQAHFDIQGALDSLKNAVELGPENALAWSRLAELYLSVGELTKAARASRQAVALNPALARTQTVLGFTLIDRVKIKAAKETFNKAIEMDSAAPLPRLGLGLAKIRGGDLKEGRAEIEIAASLDPNNSLIRSYLGKAYHEEKRDKLAEAQYQIAKKLDPLDPTAWFYDAIRKQTINRPVEALQDMQKSIELNDNRAVYRSRLLLDQDLAARSASLGRIYNDLGFQQLGLVEGWKSVNTAPANHSAHRLLADLYAALPRHEIARVSELLQSQLLQPINITPVQPQLAESNLFILEGAGPSDLSLNEFNPLFLRNRFALQANGILGENDTWGDDLIQSTVWGKLSYSLGQFHYETDGFRDNNDLNKDILNAYAQINPLPQTSFLTEYRYDDTKKGDLPLRFDSDNFSPAFRQDSISRSFRLGLRQSLASNSDIIATFIYKDIDGSTKESASTPFFAVDVDISEDEDGYMTEAQYLYHSHRLNLTLGGGHFNSDRKIVVDSTTVIPSLPPIASSTKQKADIRYTNPYIYSQINYPIKFTWTIGASIDFFEDEVVDKNQFNPKFGLIWNPFSSTLVRGAVFRVLKRSLFSDQTIEPTQVAGFNQFYDDGNGTDAWLYGGAISQKITRNLTGGLEFLWRDLDVPYQTLTLQEEHADWTEGFGRVYLYFTPYNWLALKAEYQYERFDRDLDFVGPEEIDNLKTHRLPFGVNVFLPSGFFGGLQATYLNQKGDFGDPRFGSTTEDSDNFWVADASVGYRMPKRYGLVSIGVKNLFDENFNFQDTDPATPSIYPERFVFGKVTLSF